MQRLCLSSALLPALLAILGSACTSSNQGGTPDDSCAAWMDTSLGPEARALALVSAMTLEQKIDQTHGHAPPEDFRVVLGIEALCIPDLTVTNGPAGVGPGPELLNNVPATALPSPLLLAATWDAPARASRCACGFPGARRFLRAPLRRARNRRRFQTECAECRRARLRA